MKTVSKSVAVHATSDFSWPIFCGDRFDGDRFGVEAANGTRVIFVGDMKGC